MSKLIRTGIYFCVIISATVLTTSAQSTKTKGKQCGYRKECVVRYLCQNGVINNDGTNLINLRDSLSSNYENNGCHWSEMCCPETDKIERKEEVYVSRGCGHANPNGLKIHITHADNGESQFAEFPWMVRILNGCTSGPCQESAFGGSLIAPNVVLTSAHNVANTPISNIIVRAGEWDTQVLTEPYAHQDRTVTKKILHANFSSSSGIYDIALLILKTPFQLAPNIDTICLPKNWQSYKSSACVVMGWGKKVDSDYNYPHILKKIDLSIVRKVKCQEQLRKTRLGQYFELHDSFICAGGALNKDACEGDGGAPMVCKSFSGDHYELAGIVSWGVDCGREEVPGVYANVKYLRDWILENLKLEGISIE